MTITEQQLAQLAEVGGNVSALVEEIRKLRTEVKKIPPATGPAESPRRVGNNVLIRTVTHYHTGKIVLMTDQEIVLTEAAWIADTGRFSEALESGKVSEVEPFPGPVSVATGAIVDVSDWRFDLPRNRK